MQHPSVQEVQRFTNDIVSDSLHPGLLHLSACEKWCGSQEKSMQGLLETRQNQWKVKEEAQPEPLLCWRGEGGGRLVKAPG